MTQQHIRTPGRQSENMFTENTFSIKNNRNTSNQNLKEYSRL